MFFPSSTQISEFQKTVLDWYSAHHRPLPWRETTDPYCIWISEVMSQQTQVDRVLSYYQRFISQYPTVFELSNASSIDVLRLWSGLGYNSRGLRLIQCAREIIDRYGGDFPRDEKDLLSLPGIGPYTARAIQAFAWNCDVPVIDTNIRRVLVAYFNLDEHMPISDLENFAFSCIPQGQSRIWHNALMDYGALHLTARKTKVKSLSQQGRFEGSSRQVRSWIVKQLLDQEHISLAAIRDRFPRDDLEMIIAKMIKEGILKNTEFGFAL